MPKTNLKDKNQKQNIIGKQLKDIIPSSFPHVRDPREIEYPPQGEKIYNPEYLPIDLFPEWSNAETDLENVQKSLIPENEEESQKKYIDPNNDKVLLPLSLFTDYLNMNIKWSSPENYITEIYLDKLIQKQMPKKNPFRFRAKVHECYQEELKIRQKNLEKKNNEGEENSNENNIQNSEESESDIDKKDEFFIYRDFFKILDQQLEIKVVNFITRMETEEEMNERIKRQEEELQQQMLNDKNKKGKKHPGKNAGNEIQQEKIELTLPSPNNISLKENIPPFSRWLGSIFQIIKDRNLLDVKTGENIWQKIYPQKNGVPIYNKNGHYMVKLYHMGKMRKIEIDDRMPLSQNDEFFFPRCESLEELWPALLTKALIKLYSYKIISNKFYEIGDAEPFYALTGYIPTIFKEIEINNNKISGENHNQSRIIETDSKKDESSNKENNIKNENENNLKDSLEKNNNNENNNEEEQKKEENVETISKEKIDFLEKALTDENYSNSNYLVECFKTIDKNFYKVQNDLNNLDEEEEEQIIEQMHINNNVEKPENQEHPQKENINEIIPEEDHNDIKVVDNNIESLPDDVTKKSLASKAATINNKQNNFLSSMKNKLTLTSDFSMTDYNKLEFKRIHEKLEDYSMENNLYKGILYDIVDFFDNKEYNMNRLQPIDFSDLKAMLKNFNKNNVFKQLSKEEKKEYITNLKEIKEKQRFLKAQRIESLKLKGPQYYSVKIENKGIDQTSYKAKYIEQEYQMAKKCLLNKWEFPPMDYLDKRYEEKKALEREKELQEEMEQEEKNKKKKKKDKEKKFVEKKETEENKEIKENKEKRTWSKEIYMQLINNNTEQFNESVSPITRSDGYWIESNIFFNSFNKFIVLYNPSKYNTVFNWDNYWTDTSDILTPKDENSVLYLKKITQPKIENTIANAKDKKDKNEHQPVEEIVIKNEIPCNYIVIMYEAISDKNNKLRNLPFKVNFRFIKKDEKYENGKIVKIDSFYGSERIDGLNEDSEYFLIFEGGVFPEGFFIKVISDFSISPLNYQTFLANHQGFNKQTFHVEHNALQKNEIYVILRVSILNEARSKFMIISNNTKDKYSNDFIKINICDITNRNTKKNVEFKTFFELNPGEYMLVMTINPIYVLDANSYDVDILSYSDISNSIMMDVSQTNTAVPGEQNKPLGLTMEQIEMVAPYEIIDNYHHNKNNILFKEFIFAGDKISALFHIKMIKLINENIDENGNEKVIDKNDKAKNNKLNAPSKNAEPNEIPEKQDNSLDDLVRLKLELFNKENELILTEDFYNEITLHNLVFEGNVVVENAGNKGAKKLDKKSLAEASSNTPPSNLPYRLICTIDTSEAPSQYLDANYLRNIGWCIRVFSTDTLGFCQDTSKEDKEKEIISSWEEKEPGRAELAKNSRKRFLLQQKLTNGNELSEEETNFLKVQRVRKTFNKANEEEKEDDKKGKKKVEKVDKSKKKGKEIQEKTEAEKEKENFANLNLNINYEKKTSSVQHHSSLFIKNFLSYAYDNRMLTYNSNYEQEDKELNNEILTTEKEEKINAEFMESEKQNTEKMNQDSKKKQEFKINNKKMFDKMMNHRRKEVEECKSFYETRTSLAMNIQNKIIVEKKCKNAINALINSEHAVVDDPKNKKKVGGVQGNELEEAISVYNEAEKIGLKSEIVEKLFEQISAKKEEIYKNEINKPPDAKSKNKDLKGVASKILSEINNSKWKISKEFIEELNKIKSA